MHHLTRLISEVHRRSVWQVMGVYLVSSWVTLEVVDGLTQTAGLPDWVPSFALVLLLIGFPIVLATAIVQEGAPGRTDGEPDAGLGGGEGGGEGGRPEAANLAAGTGSLDLPSTRGSFLERHLTWKRALLGGVAAFALLGLAVAAYFAMWYTGVGPVGSLVAQGVFDERERVVLADFGNTSPDPDLGTVVTEALRMDLLESPALTVVEPTFVDGVLERMERDPATALTRELAQEVAIREGIKAVLHGEVGSVGSGYVLTARLAEAGGDRTLAAFRETAEGPDQLIGAIDKLSQRIREKAGESLRSIKGGEPLDGYTTSSLEALRRYAQAGREDAAGDVDASIALLEDALALDSTFAMAWRKLGVHFLNEGRNPARARDAIARAYELRDRLTPRERHLTSAIYHDVVSGDQARVIQAYESVLESHPEEGTALNNLGRAYSLRGDGERALEYYRRAVRGPGWSLVAQTNLVRTLYNLGRVDEARAELHRAIEEAPDVPVLHALGARHRAYAGEYAAADSIYRRLLDRFGADPIVRAEATRDRAIVALFAGRVDDARSRLAELSAAAEERGAPRAALRAARDGALVRLRVLGDTAGALREVERALERVPLEGIEALNRPYLDLAGLYAEAGEVERAEALLDAYDREVAPRIRDPVVRNLRRAEAARLALASGRPAEALATFREARRNFGCTRCWLPPVGLAHEMAGRPDSAAAAYEAFLDGHDHEGFLEISLWEPWSRERLGRLYEELGRPERAAGHYRAFAEQWADADRALQPRVERARERSMELRSGTATAN